MAKSASEGGSGRMLTRLKWAVGGTMFGLAGSVLSGGVGSSDEGIIGAVGRAFTRTTESVGAGLSQARSSVGGGGLAQQIGARLNQDKTIDAERIEISVEDESKAVLRGIVNDEESKQKAVELTRDTRGVTHVIDHLAVEPEVRIIATAAEGEEAPASAAAGSIVIPRIRR